MHDINTSTKYVIHAKITADGVIERSDVIGAIFGQTEGLLSEEINLRDLQKTGRIGRIEVDVESKSGKSEGYVKIPSNLDMVEISILAAAMETIDRIGPCDAKISLENVEDVRESKRKKIVERSKEIVKEMYKESTNMHEKLVEEVQQAIRTDEITSYGETKLPAGPNIDQSDAILVVEGRADVLNLLRYGIKNVIAVEGTNITKEITDLSKKKTVTAFVDGDRGGDLILRELAQVADVDYVVVAPPEKSVEDLTHKEIVKALRNKVPIGQSDVGKRVLRRKFFKIRGRGIVDDDLEEKANELKGTSNARLIGYDNEDLKEIQVKDLIETLKSDDGNAKGVIFDGIVTQRIIDIAYEKDLNLLLGKKMGGVVKIPTHLKILTFDDM